MFTVEKTFTRPDAKTEFQTPPTWFLQHFEDTYLKTGKSYGFYRRPGSAPLQGVLVTDWLNEQEYQNYLNDALVQKYHSERTEYNNKNNIVETTRSYEL